MELEWQVYESHRKSTRLFMEGALHLQDHLWWAIEWLTRELKRFELAQWLRFQVRFRELQWLDSQRYSKLPFLVAIENFRIQYLCGALGRSEELADRTQVPKRPAFWESSYCSCCFLCFLCFLTTVSCSCCCCRMPCWLLAEQMVKVFALFSQLLTCNSNELTTQKVSDPHSRPKPTSGEPNTK